ncbi:MAG TPA: glutaredoxin family protein [Dehalococcoidia bacterium]|nr:glutaredoxin family protein [Dehalococcoidia bacterium]
MKQQCPMAFIYMSWALYIGVLAFLALRGAYAGALLVLVTGPLAQGAYVRTFPAISRYIGYGSVSDRPAEHLVQAATKVVLYTALGCPFCPVVNRRLLALQAEMGFDLEEIDVTLKPGLLATKSIRAVPVVEAGQRKLVGHATSEQLAALISGSPSPKGASTA